eukprot:CAMPEP_0115481164 /NCGR_PEP_ID=MMETSP0271-20121206/57651_1 /TAXON_ID=71861 /ORGANISM="Scrippsiella trochoidea, Strain CCMP3099" /LENGTH=73 /DNA_ID=CAMNT_0002908879 /DNA_START=1680 /DNA_END=1901 /DNA_ORIENTATION=+
MVRSASPSPEISVCLPIGMLELILLPQADALLNCSCLGVSLRNNSPTEDAMMLWGSMATAVVTTENNHKHAEA